MQLRVGEGEWGGDQPMTRVARGQGRAGANVQDHHRQAAVGAPAGAGAKDKRQRQRSVLPPVRAELERIVVDIRVTAQVPHRLGNCL